MGSVAHPDEFVRPWVITWGDHWWERKARFASEEKARVFAARLPDMPSWKSGYNEATYLYLENTQEYYYEPLKMDVTYYNFS
jgi:hypothetical protein